MDSREFHIVHIQTNTVYKFSQSKTKIKCGRSLENDIIITSPHVSRKHCLFEHDINSKKTFITDLKSSNGVHINGDLLDVDQKRELRHKDLISVGSEPPLLRYIEVEIEKDSIDDNLKEIPSKIAKTSAVQTLTDALLNKENAYNNDDDIQICYDSKDKLTLYNESGYNEGVNKLHNRPGPSGMKKVIHSSVKSSIGNNSTGSSKSYSTNMSTNYNESNMILNKNKIKAESVEIKHCNYFNNIHEIDVVMDATSQDGNLINEMEQSCARCQPMIVSVAKSSINNSLTASSKSCIGNTVTNHNDPNIATLNGEKSSVKSLGLEKVNEMQQVSASCKPKIVSVELYSETNKDCLSNIHNKQQKVVNKSSVEEFNNCQNLCTDKNKQSELLEQQAKVNSLNADVDLPNEMQNGSDFDYIENIEMDSSNIPLAPLEYSMSDYIIELSDDDQDSIPVSQLFQDEYEVKVKPEPVESNEEPEHEEFSQSIIITDLPDDIKEKDDDDGDEEIIYISDDDDDDEEITSRWKMKLKVDQDMIIKSEPIEDDMNEEDLMVDVQEFSKKVCHANEKMDVDLNIEEEPMFEDLQTSTHIPKKTINQTPKKFNEKIEKTEKDTIRQPLNVTKKVANALSDNDRERVSDSRQQSKFEQQLTLDIDNIDNSHIKESKLDPRLKSSSRRENRVKESKSSCHDKRESKSSKMHSHSRSRDRKDRHMTEKHKLRSRSQDKSKEHRSSKEKSTYKDKTGEISSHKSHRSKTRSDSRSRSKSRERSSLKHDKNSELSFKTQIKSTEQLNSKCDKNNEDEVTSLKSNKAEVRTRPTPQLLFLNEKAPVVKIMKLQESDLKKGKEDVGNGTEPSVILQQSKPSTSNKLTNIDTDFKLSTLCKKTTNLTVKKCKQINALSLKNKSSSTLEKSPKKLKKKNIKQQKSKNEDLSVKMKIKEYQKDEQQSTEKNKCGPQIMKSKTKASSTLTKKENNHIKQSGNEHLKQLTVDKKVKEVNERPSIVRPKIKISMKNRGDKLLESMNAFVANKNEELETENPLQKNSLCNYIIPKKKESDKKENKKSDEERVQEEKVLQDMSQMIIKATYQSILKKRDDNLINTQEMKKRVSFSHEVLKSEKPPINGETPFQIKVNARKKIARSKYRGSDTKLNIQEKMDEFLLEIYRWNPIWLEEQKKIKKNDPPIVNYEKLIPLLTFYTSYADYYTVMKPILLLEIWHSLIKEYESSAMQKLTLKCSIVPNTLQEKILPTSNLHYTSFLLETLVNQKDFDRQAYPSIGDLIILQYCTKGQYPHLFGYIVNLQKTVISPTLVYNKALEQHVNKPYAVITYQINTKVLHLIPEPNRIDRLKSVYYLRSTLRQIQALQNLPSSPLCKTILNPTIDDYCLRNSWTSLNSSCLFTKDALNDKQMRAVIKANAIFTANQSKICLIKGPPGTGKSKVIINIVTEIYSEGLKQNNVPKILLCAPSNAAVDELALRLLSIRQKMPKDKRFRLVRIGRIDAMHPKVKDISLTNFAEREVKQQCFPKMESCQNEIRYLNEQIILLNNMLKNAGSNMAHIEAKLNRIKTKRDYLTARDTNSFASMKNKEQYKGMLHNQERIILKKSQIIACTLNSCYTYLMESVFGNNGIPICIVDEATQCNEVETLIPLMLGVRSLILVGDSNQLPATVISQRAKALGLDQSLFSRIEAAFQTSSINPVVTLTTQYRMVDSILKWPNAYFYGNELTSSMKNDLNLPIQPYLIMNLDSKQEDHRFTNVQEAVFVTNLICSIMPFVNTDRRLYIGIITPYNEQKGILMKQFNQKMQKLSKEAKDKFVIDINTVDGFQGQERDIIIMSCVRSDGIGFLSDRQRLCVALTRAKYCLYICGNFATFRRDPMWKALLNDAESRRLFVDIKASVSSSSITSVIQKT